DLASGMFTFNENFYALLRTTPQREGGLQMSAEDYARKFLPTSANAVVTEEIARAVAATDPNFTRHFEHAIMRADGSAGVFLVHYAIVKDPAGRTVRTYGVNQDITERVGVERQRAELERQLREMQKMDAIGTLAGGI